MDANEYCLAVDCGSTNFKMALFNSEGVRCCDFSTPVEYAVTNNERVEFSSSSIKQNFECAVHSMQAQVVPKTVKRLALTSQAQTFTVLDEAGQPLCPFISWLDKRAVEEACELCQRAERKGEIHRHCSFPFVTPQMQAAKILWLTRNEPELIQAAARIVSLPEFLSLCFVGRGATDWNLAGMSGLFSLKNGRWWQDMLQWCGVSEDLFAPAVPVGCRMEANSSYFTDKGSGAMAEEVIFAGNDQTAGAYGNGCSEDSVIVTLGTALVAYRYAGRQAGPYHRAGCWGPYPDGGYYELATRDEGCRALDWAVAELGLSLSDCTENAQEYAEKILNEDVLNACPFFMPHAIGTAEAWTGEQDVRCMCYTVFEGISFSVRRLLQSLSMGTETTGPVCVIGGGSRNRFWLQLIANCLATPVFAGNGDSLSGAAAMATGQQPVPVHGKTVEEQVQPSPDFVVLCNQRYREWCHLIESESM